MNSIIQQKKSGSNKNKMLSYRRETALQGRLVLAESGRLELSDNILLIL